jgi:GT2 family glycosyltransferase
MDLIETLASLAGQTRPPEEILIVDSSEGEETRTAVESVEPAALREKIRYLRSDPGLTHQRNVGAREIRGDIAVYLDDDVILEPDYLEVLEELFSDPSIHGASGINLAAERSGPVGGWFRRFFMLPRTDGKGSMQSSGFPAWSTPPKEVQSVEILPGHNMAYRREVLESLTFNESMIGYGLMEDVEFSYRASRRHRLVVTPAARLVHKRSTTSREDGRTVFRMRVFHHFLLYRSSAPRGFTTLICFLWAHCGVLVWSLIDSVKSRSLGPFLGYVEGLAQMLFAGSHRTPATPEGTSR